MHESLLLENLYGGGFSLGVRIMVKWSLTKLGVRVWILTDSG